jgi:hypothetical protein
VTRVKRFTVSERAALRGMLDGSVDREWARHV